MYLIFIIDIIFEMVKVLFTMASTWFTVVARVTEVSKLADSYLHEAICEFREDEQIKDTK